MTTSTGPSSFTTLRIVYFALFSSTFVYLVVLHVAAPPAAEAPQDPSLVAVVGVAALGAVVASFLLPKMLFASALRGYSPAIVEAPDPKADTGLFRDQVPMRRVFADPSKVRRDVLARFTTPFILGLALTEGIAIFGFLLGFFGHGWEIVLPFFVVAWGLYAIRFPREGALFAEAERSLGARFE